LSKPTGFFRQGGDTITIRDLRVRFEIEKHIGSEDSGEPGRNTCAVTVTNLSENSRAELQVKPLHVRIDAGYDGSVSRLFQGDLRWSQSRNESVDWETRLELGDGERALRGARSNRSFEAGTTLKVVLADVAKSMGLALPANALEKPEMATQFVNGISISGRSEYELKRLLKPHKLHWSVQFGELQILSRNEYVKDADKPPIISQDTGMIGTPEYASPPKESTSNNTQSHSTLTVRSLLYPGLYPGKRVEIRSRSVNGLFRIDSVRHVGDTEGDEWQTELECRPI
jgi:hypothetical protein